MRAFTVCRFPVTLADLCSQLHSMQEESDPPAGQLWAQITEAAYRARENKSLYSYTGRAADGRSIRQVAQEANKQIFEGLPDACRAWIGTLQALIDLDGDDATGKNFRRRDFEKFYREYQAARPLDPERWPPCPVQTATRNLKAPPAPAVGPTLTPAGVATVSAKIRHKQKCRPGCYQHPKRRTVKRKSATAILPPLV